MAELRIDAKVEGINQVKALDKAVKDVESSTKQTNKEMVQFLTTLGKVTAVGYAVGKAIRSMADASREYNSTAKESARWAEQQETGWLGLKAALGDVLGVSKLLKEHDEAVLLGQQRLTAWLTGKSVEAVIEYQNAVDGATDSTNEWTDAVDAYIDKLDEQFDAQEDLNDLMQEGYQNAFQWRQSGVQEANTIAAENEAIANERLAASLAAVMSIREQFTNYAIGRNPDAQLWQSTWEGEQKTEENTDATEENTGSLKDVERAIRDQTTYTNRMTTTIAGNPNTPSYYSSNPFNAGSGMYASGWSGGIMTPEWYGARTFTGSIDGYEYQTSGQIGGTSPSTSSGTASSSGGALASGRDVLEEYLNPVVNVVEEVTKSLEEWLEMLDNSIAILADLHIGLKGFLSDLRSISSALGTDYKSLAREALYGGTPSSLQYDEAKALAESAWDVYQTDTYNQEYLDTYNDRMNDLIGSLDDFHDTTKYVSSQEQEWEKAKALYEISAMQEVQDETKSDIDRQIELLEEMVRISESQDANAIEANRILDLVKAETQAGKDATYLVRTAVNNVKTATDGVSSKTSTILNSNDAIQYNTALTAEATSDDIFGDIGQPLYQTGGYTGNGGINQVAGMVHGQEYVVNAQTTADLGLNGSGGVFQQMNNKLDLLYNLYEINKTTKRSLAVQSDTRSVLETNTNAAT